MFESSLSGFNRARPSIKDCFSNSWLQDAYLMRLRRQTLTFTTTRLKEFLADQQRRREEVATKHKVLLRSYQSSPHTPTSPNTPNVPTSPFTPVTQWTQAHMSCWDFKMRLWATVSGGTIKFAENGQDRKKTSRNQQWLGSMELSSSSSLIIKEKSFAL